MTSLLDANLGEITLGSRLIWELARPAATPFFHSVLEGCLGSETRTHISFHFVTTVNPRKSTEIRNYAALSPAIAHFLALLLSACAHRFDRANVPALPTASWAATCRCDTAHHRHYYCNLLEESEERRFCARTGRATFWDESLTHSTIPSLHQPSAPPGPTSARLSWCRTRHLRGCSPLAKRLLRYLGLPIPAVLSGSIPKGRLPVISLAR